MSVEYVDRTVVGWRAWYVTPQGHMARYTSADTRWENLPSVGVLVVLLYYRGRGTRRMSSKSWYWTEDTPYGTLYAYDDWKDAILPDDYETSPRVKRGKWAHDTVMTTASTEADMAQKYPPRDAKAASG